VNCLDNYQITEWKFGSSLDDHIPFLHWQSFMNVFIETGYFWETIETKQQKPNAWIVIKTA
jgi:hypothetical protein